MIEENVVNINKTIRTQTFICDGCGKVLGESREDSYGYIQPIGQYSRLFYVDHGYLEIEKHFCEACRDNFETEIADLLIDKGFTKQKEEVN